MTQNLGHDMRQHFCFEADWCNINNGRLWVPLETKDVRLHRAPY